MKRRALCLFLIVLLLQGVVLSVFAAPASTQESQTIAPAGCTPLLYRVTDSDGDMIYLLGSIHVGREGMYPFPSYVTDALDSCRALCLEVDPVAEETDEELQEQIFLAFLCEGDSTIHDHISPELHARCVEILRENNTYTPQLEYFNAAMWQLCIQELIALDEDLNMDAGVDWTLMEYAQEHSIEVRPVEDTLEHYLALIDHPDRTLEYVLEDVVKTYENPSEYNRSIKELLDVWCRGNEAELIKFISEDESEEEMSAEEKEYYDDYNYKITTQRDLQMTEYAVEALENAEKLFICVGAAHVIGESGIVARLLKRGYTVEIVGPEQANLPEEGEQDLSLQPDTQETVSEGSVQREEQTLSETQVKDEIKPAPNGFFDSDWAVWVIIGGALSALLAGTVIVLVVRKKKKGTPAVSDASLAPAASVVPTQPPAPVPVASVAPAAEAEPKFCENCGAPRAPEAAFCTSCGNKF